MRFQVPSVHRETPLAAGVAVQGRGVWHADDRTPGLRPPDGPDMEPLLRAAEGLRSMLPAPRWSETHRRLAPRLD
jgi:hypothetical protein